MRPRTRGTSGPPPAPTEALAVLTSGTHPAPDSSFAATSHTTATAAEPNPCYVVAYVVARSGYHKHPENRNSLFFLVPKRGIEPRAY